MALITPEFLQTKPYVSKRDRLAFMHGGTIQAGVWDAGDYDPFWTSAMNVSVAQGSALVPANNAGNVGLYHVQNDATMSVTIGAAHATLPRLDQIYLLVNDSTDGGAASDTPQLLVLAGTATSGATLDNRTGAAALPNNALRIADVLVPAAAATLSAAAVRDRRTWARGARRMVRAVGGTYTRNYTAGIAEIDATNLKPRLEISGNGLTRVTLRVGEMLADANAFIDLIPYVDGALTSPECRSQHFVGASPSAPGAGGALLDREIAIAAGSHTIAPAWSVASAGGSTPNGSILASSSYPLEWAVAEDIRQNADNA